MIVGRKRVLSDDEAEQCYRDYCEWLAARERFSPAALAKKYCVSVATVAHYGKRHHKSRAA